MKQLDLTSLVFWPGAVSPILNILAWVAVGLVVWVLFIRPLEETMLEDAIDWRTEKLPAKWHIGIILGWPLFALMGIFAVGMGCPEWYTQRFLPWYTRRMILLTLKSEVRKVLSEYDSHYKEEECIPSQVSVQQDTSTLDTTSQ